MTFLGVLDIEAQMVAIGPASDVWASSLCETSLVLLSPRSTVSLENEMIVMKL